MLFFMNEKFAAIVMTRRMSIINVSIKFLACQTMLKIAFAPHSNLLALAVLCSQHCAFSFHALQVSCRQQFDPKAASKEECSDVLK